jgi:uncharacterized RDD family membrane protein YckC
MNAVRKKNRAVDAPDGADGATPAAAAGPAPADLSQAAPPGLGRRLAAMFYDAWLIAALWLFGATVDVAIQAGLGTAEDPYRLPLQFFVIACPFLFYGWFWTHGGQTLGMRAWRLKLLKASGDPMDWRHSIVRVAAAHVSLLALGLGYLWMLVDRQCLTWHDRWSDTRLVMLTRD